MKGLIFIAEGFEECEALITVDLLRRADITIDTVSISADKAVKSSHDVTVICDRILSETDPEDYDVLIMPGGKLGTANLEACDAVREAMRNHFEAGRLTCAICAAPSVLGHMGLLKDRKYTCFPSFDESSFGGFYQNVLAVRDGNLITGRGMGATIEFAREILKTELSEDKMKAVEAGIQYEHGSF